MKLKGICPDCKKTVDMADAHVRCICEHCGGRFLVTWGRWKYLAWWENFWSAAIVIGMILFMLIYELLTRTS